MIKPALLRTLSVAGLGFASVTMAATPQEKLTGCDNIRQQGHPQQALDCFQGLLPAMNTSEEKALAMVGEARSLTGLATSLAVDPSKKEPYLQSAIKLDNQILALNPNNATKALAYNDRGFAQKTLGKVDEAERDYAKAIELDPGFEEAKTNLRLLYESAFQKDPAAFKAKQEKVKSEFEKNPTDPSLKIMAAYMAMIALGQTRPQRSGGRGHVTAEGGC